MANHDPRTQAEKARADLKRNSEMGTAPAESEVERRPSVTAETFGEGWSKAQATPGADGVTAGGPSTPDTSEGGRDNDPRRGGYGVADSEMGHEESEVLSDIERLVTGRDDDAMSRGKE